MKGSENGPVGWGFGKMKFLGVVRMALKKTVMASHRICMIRTKQKAGKEEINTDQ